MTQFGGSLRFVQLPAVIDLLHGLHADGRLSIADSGWRAEILLSRGSLVDASIEQERGRAALESICLALSDGDFTFFDGQPSGLDTPALLDPEVVGTFFASLTAERARLRSRIPSWDAVPRVAEADPSNEEVRLGASALQLLPLLMTGQTVRELARKRGAARTLRDLSTLLDARLAILGAPGPAAAPAPPPAPSHEQASAPAPVIATTVQAPARAPATTAAAAPVASAPAAVAPAAVAPTATTTDARTAWKRAAWRSPSAATSTSTSATAATTTTTPAASPVRAPHTRPAAIARPTDVPPRVAARLATIPTSFLRPVPVPASDAEPRADTSNNTTAPDRPSFSRFGKAVIGLFIEPSPTNEEI
jgi:hypothetical protein